VARNWYDSIVPADAAAPRDIDVTVAHPARVYDYWLGGKDNFAADRQAAEEVLKAKPGIRLNVRANRGFLARTVRYLAGEAGISQFLDIGTGIPTANNTHEVAQAVRPDARVVYVDNDPIVLTHARALLTSTQGTTSFIEADLRDTGLILSAAAKTLDFSKPVAIMMIAVLHLIPDQDDPWRAGRSAWELPGYIPSGQRRRLPRRRAGGPELQPARCRAHAAAQPGRVRPVLRRPGDHRAGHRADAPVAPGRDRPDRPVVRPRRCRTETVAAPAAHGRRVFCP
jgi:hypothetical protein